MELTYKGKNAIVTGASGGMGLEISKMLSENNMHQLLLCLLQLELVQKQEERL